MIRQVMDAETFIAHAMQNPVNAEILRRLKSLQLNDCYLAAGCLFQATWNIRSGQSPEHGINDYDIFYFDDADRSWEAEDAVIRQIDALCADLGAKVEVKNQARVHHWYERRFGVNYPALVSTRDGIDRYLIACTCVGIAADTGALYAPDGLDDLAAGVLRINPRHPIPHLFKVKAQSYRSRWPWLRIVDSSPAKGRPCTGT